jgi:N-acyl-D-amino-acid deacylase
MSDYDLIIRNGTIVDGSGTRPFAGDLAVRDGLIAKVGSVTGSARTEIDATGRIVTPGFVDIHTHYDGQAIWSERLIPSSQHGVTTVVLGNCGVGFAPCRPQDHGLLVSVMEGVEDIPEIVMTSGLPWDWETFPEYLDALDKRRRDIDVAAYLPHSPLRVYVMGERGANRDAATDEDLAEMKRLAADALDAGAIGFATSRLVAHRTGHGEQIPSYAAAEQEILSVGQAMREKGSGLLQMVTDIHDRYDPDIAFLERFATETGRPVTFTLAQVNWDPQAWRRALRMVDRAVTNGEKVTAQVFPRPVGMILGLDTTLSPFSLCPTYVSELAGLPMADRVARLRDPAIRARLLAETPDDPSTPIYLMARDWDRIFPLNTAADYEPPRDQSISALAAEAGVTPLEFIYDALLDKGGYALFYAALANYAEQTLDPVFEMMGNPNVVIALGDGGAHYGVVCDASYPTFVLAHWTRDRDGAKFALADAIKGLTRTPARTVGLEDRGLLAEGYKADINVIDYENLTLHAPHMIDDLPGGGRRLMQEADGFVATIVSGTVIQRDGHPTGDLPGRLVRGTRAQPHDLELA